MKLNKTLLVLGATIITALVTTSCGGNNGGGGNKVDIFDTSTVTGDLYVEDGAAMYNDEIVLNVWSIIGDPDQTKFRQLIQEFNNTNIYGIKLDVTYQGHFDYYTALDETWATDKASFPDVCFMHNEKTAEYASKGYLYPIDDLYSKMSELGATDVEIDFSQAYENIDRVTHYKEHRWAVPVDAHGFLTNFRQDIIKKNGLGFDNNTRFIPQTRAEYQSLLEGLRAKADAGELWVRNINKSAEGQEPIDHSWHLLEDAASFYPSALQSTDPDGLSALYANGGALTNEDQSKIIFNENKGFQTYVTDHVDRYNKKLVGVGSTTSTAAFPVGDIVMFSEGPWWASQTYAPQWNTPEMRTAEADGGGKGVTAEDANDPVYAYPYVASHATGWWSLDDAPEATKDSWYGNGHAISITRSVKSLEKAHAAMIFAKWYTQAMNDDGDYNLTTWASTGHVPAWKNVYESDSYKAEVAENITLQALGNPEDIIAMDSLEFESTIFGAVGAACDSVVAHMRQVNYAVTSEEALQIVNNQVLSSQLVLNGLRRQRGY